MLCCSKAKLDRTEPMTKRQLPSAAKSAAKTMTGTVEESSFSTTKRRKALTGKASLSQQNQQLDLVGGCNAMIPRDFVVRGSCSIPTAPTNHPIC
jgi:hypothetical protein